MELEGIIAFISLALSGTFAIYKIIKKIQKSNCVVITENGEEYKLNFDDLQKGFEKSIDENNNIPLEEKNKLKKIASDLMKKTKEEVSSPKGKPKKLDLV